jgi:hypothetical protein
MTVTCLTPEVLVVLCRAGCGFDITRDWRPVGFGAGNYLVRAKLLK